MDNLGYQNIGFGKFIRIVFDEFEVTNEQELQIAMAEDALKIPCAYCKEETELNKIAKFIDGDPICFHCYFEGDEYGNQ